MESKPPVICVSICERSISAIEQSMIRAGSEADILEIRLDCLDQTHARAGLRELDELLKNSPRPTILTYRPAQQGGKQELDNKTRLRFWLFDRPTSDSFLDMEFDLARNPNLFEFGKAPDWSQVICSHHDFIGVPADLDQIYAGMAKTPARILKIAVLADDAIDCLPVFRLLERARKNNRELIGIAMGVAGIATRILGPSRGAFLTYASAENDNATAPGQITARELREVYRLENINSQTEIFGVVGSPVAHSLSPRVHNAAFAAAQRNAVYIPFEVRDLPAFVRRMVHPRTREIEWNLRGLSVTAPHKQSVMQQVDWVEPAAKAIGAVNTILIDENGLSGYNTDAVALIQALAGKFCSLAKARVAVIGTGGVARAALYGLKASGATATVFGRDAQKAEALGKEFGASYAAVEGAKYNGFGVVINATPLGMAGVLEAESPAAADQLRGAGLAYDLVYNPIETRFLREAQAAGCETLGGMEMFVAQAEEQFRLWTGASVPDGVMRAAAELK